jgi:hypothetical protein
MKDTTMNERDLRDYLYANHRNDFGSLIRRRPRSLPSKKIRFPKISDLLCARYERQIDRHLQRLERLILDGKEVRLIRDSDTTTRVDLLGHLGTSGDLVVIELKKSSQTERQSFTQLLSYSNHFCTLFPLLSESTISSILIAPMIGRSVRDAFAQELIINGKNIVALIPNVDNNIVSLTPYYPSDLQYRWLENNILDDRSFTVITASFPLIEGWIDAGESNASEPPQYTKEAFQAMTAIISQKAEALGLHGFVYARQHWNELAHVFSHPNTIVLCLINPFGLFRSDVFDGQVYGETEESRLSSLERIFNQIEDNDDWFGGLDSSFRGQVTRLLLEAFDELFMGKHNNTIAPEINFPDWRLFKRTMVESVFCHNLYPRLIGLARYIYTEYIAHCYSSNVDEIHFSDDLPKFGYIAHDDFYAIWEILKGLSFEAREGQ